jgi:hypothetical protein
MRYHRRTAPAVKDGRVRKKNHWRHEPDYTRTHQVRVERDPAPRGSRHYLSPTDVTAFLNLLPDWRELSIGLQRVVLSGDTDCLGWHRPGTVAVCAWEDRPQRVFDTDFYLEHAATLARLRVPTRPVRYVTCDRCSERCPLDDPRPRQCPDCKAWWTAEGEGPVGAGVFAEFTDESVQAFLLVHVLVHELGHHHDRMTSPRKRDITRGERYAEEYALRHESRIWQSYQRVFGARWRSR